MSRVRICMSLECENDSQSSNDLCYICALSTYNNQHIKRKPKVLYEIKSEFEDDEITIGHFLFQKEFVSDDTYRYIYKNVVRIIQQGCHNWLYKPLCKDGTTGIVIKLGYEKIQEAVKQI